LRRKQIPSEALLNLRRRLDSLPNRSRERRLVIEETAALYDVSVDTLYRAVRARMRPRALRRSDCGSPRKLPQAEMERYCELIAAIKHRTSNRQGHHLSTTQALRLLEDYGVSVENEHIQVSRGILKKHGQPLSEAMGPGSGHTRAFGSGGALPSSLFQPVLAIRSLTLGHETAPDPALGRPVAGCPTAHAL
jgi:hypothetical protein